MTQKDNMIVDSTHIVTVAETMAIATNLVPGLTYTFEVSDYTHILQWYFCTVQWFNYCFD